MSGTADTGPPGRARDTADAGGPAEDEDVTDEEPARGRADGTGPSAVDTAGGVADDGTGVGAVGAAGDIGVGESYLRRTWRRFRGRPLGVAGLVVVAVIGVVGLLAPWVSPYDLTETTSEFRANPSWDHWLGTDTIGKDTLSQLLYATRTSLWASLVAVALAVVVGTAVGLCSGYFGGRVDQVLMRVVDAILSFPGLLTAMVVVGLLGPSVLNAMIGLSVAFMPIFARLVRGEVLAVRDEGYVKAALVIGCGPVRIIRRHVLPNVAPSLVVQAFMTLGFALLAEGALAFLGLSVRPPETSLGSMLRRGFGAVNATPRLVVVPGVVITLLTLAFNAIADGLRDAMSRRDAGNVEARP